MGWLVGMLLYSSPFSFFVVAAMHRKVGGNAARFLPPAAWKSVGMVALLDSFRVTYFKRE